jgi:dTDP-3-amino-3,4,6-trideoxy-alpha-D-glucose transaminase
MTALVASPPVEVPFLDLAAANAELGPELAAAAQAVIASQRVLLGPELERFEAAFAARVGARHCVGVGNGLDALALGLRALGVRPGDEVIVPSHTFIATWLAVSQIGAVPVPVEPDVATCGLDADRVAAALGPRTRAIVPVHLYGQPADIGPIVELAERHGLAVLDDAAQAHGASYRGRPVGALAHATAWSFYPGKNLGAVGDGGGVTTDDPEVARRLRSLRNYGSSEKYVHDEAGVNSRLDELQAALLSVKLARLDDFNARRARVAERYLRELADADLVLPRTFPWADPAWHLFVVRSPRRDALREALAADGVQTLVHYPIPPHRQRAYAGTAAATRRLPVADRLAAEVLSLPMGPHLTDAQQRHVIDAVREHAT